MMVRIVPTLIVILNQPDRSVSLTAVEEEYTTDQTGAEANSGHTNSTTEQELAGKSFSSGKDEHLS